MKLIIFITSSKIKKFAFYFADKQYKLNDLVKSFDYWIPYYSVYEDKVVIRLIKNCNITINIIKLGSKKYFESLCSNVKFIEFNSKTFKEDWNLISVIILEVIINEQ